MNIFEQSARQKLRFTSNKGDLTTEQLWDVPLTSRTGFDLDTIARGVSKELKGVAEESFVATSTNPAKAGLELRLEVLKHIIAVKLQQAADAANNATRSAERVKLLGVLAKKQDAALEELTPEQIQARLAALS